MNTVLTVIHTLFALGLISSVLLQSGKSAGLSGTITGGAEQIFGKKKGMDEMLSRVSTVFAILFIVSSIILVVIEVSYS